MKRILLSSLVLSIALTVSDAQQMYCDFEANKVIVFGQRTGVLDSAFANPAPDTIDSSLFCAKYVRDTMSVYDFIKIYPDTTLTDVTPYTSNTQQTPKMKMKLYTTAPVGTM